MDFFEETELSVKDWLITMIIVMIPIVGIIFLIIWAFSDVSYRRTRKNWAIATLILMGVAIMIYLIIFVVIIALGGYNVTVTTK